MIGTRVTRARWRTAFVGACVLTLSSLALLMGSVPVALGVTDASSTTPRWVVQHAPAPVVSEGRLADVSCGSATSCMAVGAFINGSGRLTGLAESWTTNRWVITGFKAPSGATASQLNGVSCASSVFCVAVGSYTTGAGRAVALAEVWNGSGWQIQSVVDPTGAFSVTLSGVSCLSSTTCIAVGDYYSSGDHPLAEGWDGTSWRLQAVPQPIGQASLAAVSCSSSATCTAVGFSYNGISMTLAERWNGTNWQIQSTPGPAGGELDGVSCPSATSCIAVGDYSPSHEVNVTLAESWDGSTWQQRSIPNPAGGNENFLKGVSCTASTACIAVGYQATSGGEVTLAERWDGTTWQLQSTPNPAGPTHFFGLAGVSCTSSTACMAAWQQNNPAAGYGTTLAEDWDGTSWHIQTTKVPASAATTNLRGISCPTSTECVAVGGYTNGAGFELPLAEVWDGTRWQIESTPNPVGATSTLLFGVSCSSSTACTAVGGYNTSAGTQLMAERWNGHGWQLQPMPSPPDVAPNTSNAVTINAVSCPSANACTAVGYYLNTAFRAVTLAEHWDGTSWQLQSTPRTKGANNDILLGVSCPSSNECVAVGDSGEDTLAELWNGTAWQLQSLPTSSFGVLENVSCATATACSAVGSSSSGTLAVGWNGTSWQLQSTPSPPEGRPSLDGVSCASPTTCTAVGTSDEAATALGAAEQWNGASWQRQVIPNPGSAAAEGNLLFAVSCAAPAACTAVGTASRATDVPLVERFS